MCLVELFFFLVCTTSVVSSFGSADKLALPVGLVWAKKPLDRRRGLRMGREKRVGGGGGEKEMN